MEEQRAYKVNISHLLVLFFKAGNYINLIVDLCTNIFYIAVELHICDTNMQTITFDRCVTSHENQEYECGSHL